MARQENSLGQRSQEGGRDIALTNGEVGKEAGKLIPDLKAILRQTPGFKRGVSELEARNAQKTEEYSLWTNSNPLEEPIIFTEGDYSYHVRHTISSSNESLSIEKIPLKSDEHDWSSEKLTLETNGNIKTHQIRTGSVSYLKIDKKYGDWRDFHAMSNSSKAIIRAKDFITNFRTESQQSPSRTQK